LRKLCPVPVENAEYKRGARLIFEISPWITWHGFLLIRIDHKFALKRFSNLVPLLLFVRREN